MRWRNGTLNLVVLLPIQLVARLPEPTTRHPRREAGSQSQGSRVDSPATERIPRLPMFGTFRAHQAAPLGAARGRLIVLVLGLALVAAVAATGEYLVATSARVWVANGAWLTSSVVAVVGVGNNTSALVQGIALYRQTGSLVGIRTPVIDRNNLGRMAFAMQPALLGC